MTTLLRVKAGAVAALAISLFGAGCGGRVVSQETYSVRARQIDDGNNARRKEALEKLRTKGYGVLTPSTFVALDFTDRERCESSRYPIGPKLTEADTMKVTWKEGEGRDGETIDMPAKAACDFFAGATSQLERPKPNGGREQVARVPEDGAALTDPQGRLTLVTFRQKIVKTEDITLEGSCNLMPSPAPMMIEDSRDRAVVPMTAPPLELELEIEETYLKATCEHPAY